jgi:hypothetical protein
MDGEMNAMNRGEGSGGTKVNVSSGSGTFGYSKSGLGLAAPPIVPAKSHGPSPEAYTTHKPLG